MGGSDTGAHPRCLHRGPSEARFRRGAAAGRAHPFRRPRRDGARVAVLGARRVEYARARASRRRARGGEGRIVVAVVAGDRAGAGRGGAPAGGVVWEVGQGIRGKAGEWRLHDVAVGNNTTQNMLGWEMKRETDTCERISRTDTAFLLKPDCRDCDFASKRPASLVLIMPLSTYKVKRNQLLQKLDRTNSSRGG